MASKNKPTIEKKQETNKQFSYRNDAVKLYLQFTLNIDNSKELRAYKDLLNEAIKDLDEEIEKHKN